MFPSQEHDHDPSTPAPFSSSSRQWRRGRCTMHSPSPFFGKSPKSSSHLRIFPLEQNPRQTNVQLKIKTLLSKITLPRPEHECSSVFHLRSRVATKSYRKCFSTFFETDFLCICPIWNVGYPHTAPEALQLSTSTLFSETIWPLIGETNGAFREDVQIF